MQITPDLSMVIPEYRFIFMIIAKQGQVKAMITCHTSRSGMNEKHHMFQTIINTSADSTDMQFHYRECFGLVI